MPVFEIGGGDVMLASGFDYRTTNYDRSISEANANEDLLFLSQDTPYELDRDQWGLFVEALFPILSNLEVTGSIRYDDISAVSDELNGGDIDSGDDAVTYKISALWNAADTVAFRGSYGTGFKAPSMREIGEPLSDFGVTSGNFDCPLSPPDPLASTCLPPDSQYNVFREGSADLEFETSKQYTFGIVLTPWERFDFTLDYWNIELEDLVERLTENQIMDNPDIYRHLYTTKTNQATQVEELAIIQAAINAGERNTSGIDYAINKGFDLNWGQLDVGLNGTYMIEAESSLTGSSLGRFGDDDNVIFRNIINLHASLYHGDFTHTVFVNYRSGYHDQEQEVEVLGTGAALGDGPTKDVQLKIGTYATIDYQLRYMMLEDKLGLTVGVQNLADEEPPLSLRTSGSGHQVGWDPRYTDAYGRTWYLQAAFSFF